MLRKMLPIFYLFSSIKYTKNISCYHIVSCMCPWNRSSMLFIVKKHPTYLSPLHIHGNKFQPEGHWSYLELNTVHLPKTAIPKPCFPSFCRGPSLSSETLQIAQIIFDLKNPSGGNVSPRRRLLTTATACFLTSLPPPSPLRVMVTHAAQHKLSSLFALIPDTDMASR